jgi:hypothetical protein
VYLPDAIVAPTVLQTPELLIADIMCRVGAVLLRHWQSVGASGATSLDD